MKKAFLLLIFLYCVTLLQAQNPFPDTWTRCETYRKEPDRTPELTHITEYDRKKKLLKITRPGRFGSVVYHPEEGNWGAYASIGKSPKDSSYWVTTKKERKTWYYFDDTLTGYTVSTLNKKGRAIRSVAYGDDKTIDAKETCTYLHDTLIASRVRYTYWDDDNTGMSPSLDDSTIWQYNDRGQLVAELKYDRYTHQVDSSLSSWYSYENNGKTKKWQSFDTRDGQRVVFRNFTETVDEKGRKIEFIEDAQWWGIYDRHVYRYNEQGNLTEELLYNEVGELFWTITCEYRYFE